MFRDGPRTVYLKTSLEMDVCVFSSAGPGELQVLLSPGGRMHPLPHTALRSADISGEPEQNQTDRASWDHVSNNPFLDGRAQNEASNNQDQILGKFRREI